MLADGVAAEQAIVTADLAAAANSSAGWGEWVLFALLLTMVKGDASAGPVHEMGSVQGITERKRV